MRERMFMDRQHFAVSWGYSFIGNLYAASQYTTNQYFFQRLGGL